MDMEAEYGSTVKDGKGKLLGEINYIVKDTWTGGIKKFIVRRKAPDTDIHFSPEDILETTNSEVKLKVTLEDITGNNNESARRE